MIHLLGQLGCVALWCGMAGRCHISANNAQRQSLFNLSQFEHGTASSDPSATKQLISALESDYIIDAEVVADAIQRGKTFQALDKSTLIKINFY